MKRMTAVAALVLALAGCSFHDVKSGRITGKGYSPEAITYIPVCSGYPVMTCTQVMSYSPEYWYFALYDGVEDGYEAVPFEVWGRYQIGENYEP